MYSISTKIKWIVFVLSLNLITIIFVNIWLNYDQKNDAKLMNIAGKERMLSQKTVLELYRFFLKEQGSYERFIETKKEFTDNFYLLMVKNSGFQRFSNVYIQKTMEQVKENWEHMEVLIKNYLVNKNNLDDLETIYLHGTQTLSLMDKAVKQYENYMMEKRLMAYRVQIVLAIVSFLIILYMAKIVLNIQRNFETFLEHSRNISGAKNLEDTQGNELDIACAHIDYFLNNVEDALQSATEAVEKSELYVSSLINSSPEAEALIEQSEDMMIQLTEELHQTAQRLNKLKYNLKESQQLKTH